MTDTSIEWTDKTWNPVTGCTKVSPGCAHCYAEGVADRFWATQYPPVEYTTCSNAAGCRHEDGSCKPFTEFRPRKFEDVLTHSDRLDQPLRWRKPARIFVNSMSDLFHEDVPDEFIDRVFAVMAEANQHTYQVLTKRAERMLAYLTTPDVRQRIATHVQDGPRFWPLLNVWVGVSVENQHFADERIPLLLQTPAAVRFVSAEPLLGRIDCSFDTEVGPLSWLERHNLMDDELTNRVDWMIVGGESGPKARLFHAGWARGIVRQCQRAGVPVFVKQLGSNASVDGVSQSLHKKGGDMTEWPADLRIREYPR